VTGGEYKLWNHFREGRVGEHERRLWGQSGA